MTEVKTIVSIEPLTEYKIRDLINIDERDDFLNYLENFDSETEYLEITIKRIPK